MSENEVSNGAAQPEAAPQEEPKKKPEKKKKKRVKNPWPLSRLHNLAERFDGRIDPVARDENPPEVRAMLLPEPTDIEVLEGLRAANNRIKELESRLRWMFFSRRKKGGA